MPFFIEVGSCDFDTCETIIQNGWRGIVIEPVKYYFDKLHKYPNIYYENIAISNHNGESEIYYINPNDIKTNDQEWMKGISSLKGMTGPLSFPSNKSLDLFKSHLKQTVKTTTLDELCKKYNIDEIDFLKIDTEGHDLIVLQSLKLDKVYVKMIKIEHKHLDSERIINHLKRYSYLCWREEDDIYAIK